MDHILHRLAVAREHLDLVEWNTHTLDAQIAGFRSERDQVRGRYRRCWKRSPWIAVLASRRRNLNDMLRSFLVARRALKKYPNLKSLEQARADLIVPHVNSAMQQVA